MTHAEEAARLRDAVVEAAKEFVSDQDADSDLVALEQAVDAIIAAEALTCETCGGSGHNGGGWNAWAEWVDRECPACHGTGRKPDTFRDDGATTPEGHEEQQGS